MIDHPIAIASLALLGFTAADCALGAIGLASPYYAIHALHNAYIVWSTAPEVYDTFMHFGPGLGAFTPNIQAALVVAALHLYHIILYKDSLRKDDWLHHGLMIGVAIPLGLVMPSATLLGFSLFFSTGLPGGIDYALLFLTRNGWLHRLTEKRVNAWLNVWIRSPGCVAHAALTAAYILSNRAALGYLGVAGGLLPAVLIYWNGQYFMRQVVTDYAIKRDTGAMHEV